MPELPEVEVMRRTIEAHVFNAKLIKAEALDKRIAAALPINWSSTIERHELSETRRVGKYLFLFFTDAWLHLHFGMTGSVRFEAYGNELPKYARLALSFDNGLVMYFTDPRTFGKMDLVNRIDSFVSTKKLGKDLLDATNEDADKMFSNRKISLKAILLKQQIVAGIGNWLADEALFRRNLHPGMSGASLSKDAAAALLEEAKKIAHDAIEADTHYGEFPAHYFVHYRKEGEVCPCGDAQIVKTTLAGRTTYFCSKCQPIDV